MDQKLAARQQQRRRQKMEMLVIKRTILQQDFLLFCQFVFKIIESSPMLVNWHHHYFADICTKVYNGELRNVIINVAPGSSKTLFFSVMFPLWCYAKNPHCKFLCTSFSDDRLSESSVMIKDVLSSKEFKELFPGLEFKSDTNAKQVWKICSNERVVGQYTASTLSGQITGGRAGYMVSGFTGAIIVDDPIKPADVWSDSTRNKINRRFPDTLLSRRAIESTVDPTPIIMVMQKLHANDPTSFLMEGGTELEWTNIVIPAIIDRAYIEQLPKKIRRRALIDCEEFLDESALGECSYWAKKENYESLKNKEKATPFHFMTQYMQQTVSLDGGVFKSGWWVEEEEMPNVFDYVKVVADTAQKTGEQHDFSVFLAYGVKDNDIYLLNMLRGKYEAPELKEKAVLFYESISRVFENTRGLYIEDKASGTGLIQVLRKETTLPIHDVQRNKDKYSRAIAAQPYVSSGRVHIPLTAPWKEAFICEMSAFSENLDAKHDDIVDCVVTAIELEYITSNKATVSYIPIF